MEATPGGESQQASGTRSSRRRWPILLGALILFVVVLELLGRLAGSDTPAEVESEPSSSLEPVRAEVVKLGRTGVRVTVEDDYRMTQNLHDEVKADRLVVCIEEGFATSSIVAEEAAGRTSLSGGLVSRNNRAERVWHEVIRIHNGCTVNLDLEPPEDRPWRN